MHEDLPTGGGEQAAQTELANLFRLAQRRMGAHGIHIQYEQGPYEMYSGLPVLQDDEHFEVEVSAEKVGEMLPQATETLRLYSGLSVTYMLPHAVKLGDGGV